MWLSRFIRARRGEQTYTIFEFYMYVKTDTIPSRYSIRKMSELLPQFIPHRQGINELDTNFTLTI